MKSVAIGIVIMLLVLGGLYVATEGNFSSSPQAPIAPVQNDSSYGNLKIN